MLHTSDRWCWLATPLGILVKPLPDLEQKTEALAKSHHTFSHNNQAQLKQLSDALRELLAPPDTPMMPIGIIKAKDKGDGKKTGGGARLKI